jgi:polar amino acid transport system substrate-binding protein
MRYIFVVTLFLAACSNFPADPRHTFNEVANATMKVGYTENPPWVVKTAKGPQGIEVTLVEEFAQQINAKVQWINGSEQALFEKMEKYELDMIIGGLTNKTPWKTKRVGITRPYVIVDEKEHVMVVKSGENRFLITLEKFLQSEKKRINQLMNAQQ